MIDSEFAPVLGLPCWGVHWDCDLGVRIDFGAPHLDVREPTTSVPSPGKAGDHHTYRHVYVHGDWRLFIDGFWKLALRDRPLVRGTSPVSEIQMALARLDGQRLVSVSGDSSTGATRFTFDLGAALYVRRTSRGDDYEMWMLQAPDGRFLQVRGDGSYALSYDELERNWRPLAPRA